jgi:diguanylate cyclase (GGDEF)-like protein/PAS domain S-box-containing protein
MLRPPALAPVFRGTVSTMVSADIKNRSRQQRLLYLTGTALLFALAILVLAMAMQNQQSRNASEESRRQVELNIRLRQLQSILISLGDAETGQRGYMLTGDPEYLAPYRTAIKTMPSLLVGLDGLEAIHSGLHSRAEAVKAVVQRKLVELAETIRLYEGGRHTDALILVQTGVGRQAMLEARQEITGIADAIRADRDRVAAQMARSAEKRQMLAIAAVGALALCVVLVGAQIGLLLAARTRFERKLVESETRHRKIVEDQAELISLAQPDGTLTYVNPAYARQLGTTPETLTGQNLFDHVEPAHRDQVHALVEKVLASGTPINGENRMLTHDGRDMWVAWTNSVQTDAQGHQQLHSVGRDITPQKMAEAALRESEEFLSRTGRLAGVGGWEVDLLTGKVRWSDQVRRLHDVPDDFEPTVEDGISFFDPTARATVETAVKAAQQAGIPFDLELPLVTAKGRRLSVRVVGDAQRDAQGTPVRLVGAMQDVTDRKELEDRIRESERFVREITDNLPVAIAYVDKEGRYQFVNKVHVNRFQRPREEILGKTRGELTNFQMEGAQEMVTRVLEGKPQRFTLEETWGDELRRIDGQMVPAYDEHGAVKGFYATGVDITELMRTEMRLRELTEILEHTPDFVVETDRTGRVQYLNPAARRVLGYSANEPIEHRFFHEFNTPETNARFVHEVMPAIKRDSVWLGEATVLGKDNAVLPVNHLVIGHRDAKGSIVRFSAIMRDISSELRARAELKLQTSTLHTVIESMPAMVAVFDRNFRYRMVNREFERQRALRREDVIGRSVAEIFGQEEYDQRWTWVQKVLAGETVAHERASLHAGNMRNVWVTYIPLRLEDGTVDGFITVAQDITAHRAEERRLHDLSERDPLTALLNRAGFNTYLARHAATMKDGGLALLYIDLDRFKPVNDQYGHATGDAVLQQYAQRMTALVRPTDAVARLGGDEFAIVLAGVRYRATAIMIASKIVDAAHHPFQVKDLKVHIGASVGIAVCPEDGADIEALMAFADEKVYAAKAAGRGRSA